MLLWDVTVVLELDCEGEDEGEGSDGNGILQNDVEGERGEEKRNSSR